MLEVICLSFAFVLGLIARACGLPALIGFLTAGFLINPLQDMLHLPHSTPEILDHVAHLGVLLLLFTVGLKLKLKSLVQPEVIGGGLLHFAVTVGVFAPGLHWLGGIEWTNALILAIALALNADFLGLQAQDLNLITAVLVTLAIVLPGFRTKLQARMTRRASSGMAPTMTGRPDLMIPAFSPAIPAKSVPDEHE